MTCWSGISGVDGGGDLGWGVEKRLVAPALCVCISHAVTSDSATPWTVVHQAPLSMGFPR